MRILVKINSFAARLKLRWWKLAVPMYLKQAGIEIGENVIFYGFPVVSMAEKSRIIVESNCALCSVSEFTALGVNHPVILRTVRPNAIIRIAPNSGISGATICAAVSVEIGTNVLLGANVTVMDTDFHAIKPEGRRKNKGNVNIKSSPVVIGDNVFVGSNSHILKGVHIGENSVIRAGSVVVNDIPANVIAVGNPAHVVRTI